MKSIQFVALMLLVSTMSLAKAKLSNRGSFGFLFADPNKVGHHTSIESGIASPSQLPLSEGFSAMGEYQSGYTGVNEDKLMTGSMSMGIKKIGIGAFYQRQEIAFFDWNVVGGGIGVALLQNALTVGVSYSHWLDEIMGEKLGQGIASIIFNPTKGEGFSLGVGGGLSTGLFDTKSARASFGYSFKSASNFELGVIFPDIEDTNLYIAMASGLVSIKNVFLSSEYRYYAIEKISEVTGALGWVVVPEFEVSGFAGKTLVTESELTWGARARIAL